MLLYLSLALIFLLQGNPAVAFSYFSGEIDYWREKPTKEPPLEVKEQKESETSFDWNKHSDPKNDEFFREGEYLPPAPFMELARHPSDDNIKRWFDYIGKKNEVSQRLHQRMFVPGPFYLLVILKKMSFTASMVIKALEIF